MIKSIMSQGKYTTVSNGYSNPVYFNSTTQLSAGNLRYNPNSQTIEVYDGYAWHMINSSHASVGLTYEAEAILDWAKEKQERERKLTKLAEQHPILNSLVKERQTIDDKIEVVLKLLMDDVKIGSD